ncbi:MAG: DUF2270 domain-containing protein [Candidatus Natronoplasma sp.]
MKEPDPEQFVEHQDSADFTQIVTHMYRAEVQRSYNWRNRLDRTTEWSIVILSALTTWTFTMPKRRHELLLSVLIFMGTLLWIEGRRYRYYNLWASRIKTLEENFLAKTLSPEKEVSTREWMKTLADDLRHPTFKIPLWVAIAHRLRRVYFWLFSLTIMLWIGKLAIHPSPASSLIELIGRASILGLQGYLVMISVGVLLTLAGIGAIVGSRREIKGVKIVEKRGTGEDWEKMT